LRVEVHLTQSKTVADGTERHEDVFPPTTSDFRLYELLKNDSRFFRIAGASGHARQLASAMKAMCLVIGGG
jgi:hypothetical protein